MPVNRADYGTVPTPATYLDLSLGFELEPEGGNVGMVADQQAVAQFLRCLIQTNVNEWPFEPQNGTRIAQQLFGFTDGPNLAALAESIRIALQQKAPMVNILKIAVNPNANNTALQLLIYWSMISNPGQVLSTVSSLALRGSPGETIVRL